MSKLFKIFSAVAVLTILSSNTSSVQAKSSNIKIKSNKKIENSDTEDQKVPENPMQMDTDNSKKLIAQLVEEKIDDSLNPKDLHKHFSEIGYEAFANAIEGFNKIENKKDNLLTIIDYTKPSTEERFYVIDLKKNKVLYKSHVAHGKNSGENYTIKFSNRVNSYQTSYGFFRTAETYHGGNGYSLRLDGLEPGINDNARARAIVIHGAAYANPRKSYGTNDRLGRSLGCPALPTSLNKKVIDTIKNGTIIYAHANESSYAMNSRIINAH
ncbi:MAG: murein L,D-transpeptidase catalytic domain family protein [Fusobacteriaceae bacterium]